MGLTAIFLCSPLFLLIFCSQYPNRLICYYMDVLNTNYNSLDSKAFFITCFHLRRNDFLFNRCSSLDAHPFFRNFPSGNSSLYLAAFRLYCICSIVYTFLIASKAIVTWWSWSESNTRPMRLHNGFTHSLTNSAP